MQNIGGVDKQIRAGHISHAGDFLAELLQFPLGSLPREIGVVLAEARHRQAVEPRASGKGLGKEDDLGVGGVHRFDQPIPEVRGLSVWIVHAESLHAVLDPEHHHTEDLGINTVGIIIKVQGVNVLVLLRGIFRISDGAVRKNRKPLGVLSRPGMVGGALQSKIEGDLDAKLLGLLNQRIKVLQGAQIRVDGVVTTGCRSNSPRASDIVRLRGQGIVAALAVNLTNGVNGWEVHGVKTHACRAL